MGIGASMGGRVRGQTMARGDRGHQGDRPTRTRPGSRGEQPESVEMSRAQGGIEAERPVGAKTRRSSPRVSRHAEAR